MLATHLASLLEAPGEPTTVPALTRTIEAFFGAQAGPGSLAEAIGLAKAAITRVAELEGRDFHSVLLDLESKIQ